MASLAGALGGIGGSLIGDALGGNTRGTPPDLVGGGLKLRISSSPNEAVVRSTSGRRGLVQGISDIFGQRAEELAGLRSTLGQGFQNVLGARLDSIRNARSRAIGSITENLSQRRVLGSSFGQAAIAQAEREFGEAEAGARAQTFLESIEGEQQLINAQTSALVDQLNTSLNELNTQVALGAGAFNAISSSVTQNSLLQQELAAEAARGFGAFGAEVGGGIFDIFT